MRSLKTSGGLAHGSGMNEEQRSLWTMSMPVTAMYNMAMQDFNNLTYTTSYEHKETTDAHLNRGKHDLAKINARLIPSTQFSEDRSLRNIVTGIEAPSATNVHEYKAVGMNIINTMVCQSAFQYSFQCSLRIGLKPLDIRLPCQLPQTAPSIPPCCFRDSSSYPEQVISPCRK